MINKFTEKEFYNMVYKLLEPLKYNITLAYPNIEVNTFPLIELHNPLKNIIRSDNGFPLLCSFQMTITIWSDKTRECMNLIDIIEEELIKKNIQRTNISNSLYDSVLQKYSITTTYETKYNALTNAFQIIK